MTLEEKFYKNQVILNVLVNSTNNAKEVYEAAEGNVLIGLLSKNYDTIDSAVQSIKKYEKVTNGNISLGLGGGDNKQANIVSEIVKYYPTIHINQVFPYVGKTRVNLADNDCWVNALVSPTGTPGYVNISTGPISDYGVEKANVTVKSAIRLVRDMGGNALKYFPMKGLDKEDEYRAVAKACGEEKFPLEPTGGININNFESILKIALKANVPKVIPHVYSSIICKETGETRPQDVKKLFYIIKKAVES